MSYEKIKKPCKEYLTRSHGWAVVRLAVAGKTAIDLVAMHDNPYIARPAYADKSEKSHARVKNYWLRAQYFNATARTETALAGFIFSRPVTFEAPDRMLPFKERADNLAKACVSELLAVGKHGFLVDLPQGDGGAKTIAELSQLMPTITPYKVENILFWRESGGKLVEVRLLETYEKPKGDNPFEYEELRRVRRLFLEDGFYKASIYNADGTEQHFDIKANSKQLTEIPFFFAGAENNAPGYDKSPLFDLASKNLGHYSLSADNLENLHYHGQGMTNIFTGLTREEVEELNPGGLDVGASGSNILESGDRIEVLQLGASGAIPTEMDRVERRMIMAGAMLVTNTATQTLGAKKIEFGAATSTLKNVATNAGKAIEGALKVCAKMIGISDSEAEKITYTLAGELPTDDLTAQELQFILAGVQQGAIPQVVLFDALRNRGLTTLSDELLQDHLANGAL